MSLDATVLSSNQLVSVKCINSFFHQDEVSVVEYLNSSDLKNDDRNHCVPLVLDTLHPAKDKSFMVTPLLRSFDDPQFDTIGELVDFLRQAFEGLDFMHDHNVAYRCSTMEMMLDPVSLYPEMYHPIAPGRSRDLSSQAHHTTRTVQPSKYYFTDFGNAKKYKPDDDRLAGPVSMGLQQQPPEFRHSSQAQDPFPTDVYYLGDMIRRELIQKYRGLEFLSDLVKQMTAENPAQRPTIKDAANTFSDAWGALTVAELRARLVPVSEAERGWLVRAARIVRHTFRTMSYRLQGLPPVPARK
ncbi:hypothetical protein BXZ70DRAFT_912609 [Cristinia sonorae]|uniref:Protein kinase domain-containing protein n=1 Tax=Cristinia sonorae TaxID=1940300 RepID=A0A8K0UY37_9AGAR|nr:hypothetical protein BXZ70DRAFT_912609 [Cristinia sonorae]